MDQMVAAEMAAAGVAVGAGSWVGSASGARPAGRIRGRVPGSTGVALAETLLDDPSAEVQHQVHSARGR